MQRQIRVVASLLAVCLLSLGSALAADKVKGKGVITLRSGNTLTVETDDDAAVTVVVTPDTKVRHPIGLGARKKEVGQDVLIPGLKLKFEGTGDQNQVTAETITFDRDDLSLARVIQAGLNPTAQQQAANMERYAVDKSATDAAIAASRQEIEANRQRIADNKQGIEQVAQATNKRFSELTDWGVKTEANVGFAVGDSTLSAENKQKIRSLAQEAVNLKGYVIEVKGFADSTGSLAANQQLSKDRAEAVVAYLLQDCGVPVKNIVAPGAMSETHPVASNETAIGRAENRRVTLRLLVNKGVAGGGS